MNFILPVFFLLLFSFAFFKKINLYTSFVKGAKEALSMCFSLFPFLAAIFIAVELMKVSGLMTLLTSALSPVLSFLGIPDGLAPLVLLRPFSGSGSLALVKDIYAQFGVDSFEARCASVLVGSSETVFYLSTVYFSETKVKKLGVALPIALFCCLLSAVLACFLCRFL